MSNSKEEIKEVSECCSAELIPSCKHYFYPARCSKCNEVLFSTSYSGIKLCSCHRVVKTISNEPLFGQRPMYQCEHQWFEWNKCMAQNEIGSETLWIQVVCGNCNTFKKLHAPPT